MGFFFGARYVQSGKTRRVGGMIFEFTASGLPLARSVARATSSGRLPVTYPLLTFNTGVSFQTSAEPYRSFGRGNSNVATKWKRICVTPFLIGYRCAPRRFLTVYRWLGGSTRSGHNPHFLQLPLPPEPITIMYWCCSLSGAGMHQENAESDWKRLEALPVLTVDPKRVEARGIMTECIFSHWFALLALDSDEVGGVRAWNKQ